MIKSIVLIGPLNGQQIIGIFDYANQLLVSSRISTNSAGVGVGDIATPGSVVQCGLDVLDGLCNFLHPVNVRH